MLFLLFLFFHIRHRTSNCSTCECLGLLAFFRYGHTQPHGIQERLAFFILRCLCASLRSLLLEELLAAVHSSMKVFFGHEKSASDLWGLLALPLLGIQVFMKTHQCDKFMLLYGSGCLAIYSVVGYPTGSQVISPSSSW